MKSIQTLNPEKLGASLKEVEVRYAGEGESKVGTQWYHGGVDADVFVWTDHKSNVIKQQVNISGSVTEWNILDGLRTGMVVEQEVKESEASESLRFDSAPNSYIVDMAIRMLKQIPTMDEPTRAALLVNFRQPQSFGTLTPEEILFRFGELPKGVKLKFIQKMLVRIRRWLS